MNFNLSLIEHKIEFFESFSLADLEKKIDTQIENNKALLLEPSQINYQTLYHPDYNKVLYSASVHFKLKK